MKTLEELRLEIKQIGYEILDLEYKIESKENRLTELRQEMINSKLLT